MRHYFLKDSQEVLSTDPGGAALPLEVHVRMKGGRLCRPPSSSSMVSNLRRRYLGIGYDDTTQ